MSRFQLPWVLVFIVGPAPIPAQETPAADLAAIGALLHNADAARAAGKHDEARAIVRQALATWRGLPGARDRQDAHDLLVEVAAAAQRAAELHSAHDAYEHVLDYRARTLPDHHPDVQRARSGLAQAKFNLGDLRGALALREKVYAVCAATLPDDDDDLQWARHGLAGTKYMLGDLRGALELQEKVHAVFSVRRPDDHPDLQRARNNLALTRMSLGDLRGALALQEKVHAIRSAALADDDPALQEIRANLAVTRFGLGDLRGALALEEKVFAIESRTLPDDHPDLQKARCNLAGTKRLLGDLRGALALEEKVFEVCSRTLPDDHHDLQAARVNLATTKRELGDLHGALLLQEKVLAVSSRTLADDHPDLQTARQNLGATKSDLGDLRGSLELAEQVHAIQSKTLPDDHPHLQTARSSLAAKKRDDGDLQGALELQQKVLAVESERLAEDHPDLQRVRSEVAFTAKLLGDLPTALELQQRVHAVRTRTLADDHPDLQRARASLAWTHLALGSSDRAAAFATEHGAASRRRLTAWTLAPREVGAMATQEQPALHLLLTLARGFDADAKPELARDALLVSQTLRGADTRTARRAYRARSVDADKTGELERGLREAVDEVGRAVSEAPHPEENAAEQAARRLARDQRLARAVSEKERLQRALLALAAKAGGIDTAAITVEDLAAALPARSAAGAIVGYVRSRPDPEHRGRTIDDAELAALVLDRTGAVALRPLGSRAAVEALVATFRAQVGAGRERGLVPRDGEDPLDAQRQLRRAVLDPMLAAAGDVDTLWLSVDEAIELVPLDALARDDAEPVGTGIALRPLVSLFDLLEPTGRAVGAEPELLAIGGLDYEKPASPGLPVVGDALAPAVDAARAGPVQSFRPLLDASTEVRSIAGLFAATFTNGHATLLRDSRASKSALLAGTPQATFVHLATHGYFAPEMVRSTANPVAGTRTPSAEQTISGMSPLVLCGLALSGANLPADALGRHAGILTAEEILSLDLSRCYLVTLSACDTSLGVRRAGQGYASLRAALQGAGARYVLTSLWKVGDEATMELMVDFYRRLWLQQKEPHAALWAAKLEARRKGAVFRDWAGWVLTGR